MNANIRVEVWPHAFLLGTGRRLVASRAGRFTAPETAHAPVD